MPSGTLIRKGKVAASGDSVGGRSRVIFRGLKSRSDVASARTEPSRARAIGTESSPAKRFFCGTARQCSTFDPKLECGQTRRRDGWKGNHVAALAVG